ncbi:hypothetical protein KAU88_06555 [Candidatus Bathyarchaeota archaeon]|nr:hypothetical protein [Candidatus Bathyarchaeota archaeon]
MIKEVLQLVQDLGVLNKKEIANKVNIQEVTLEAVLSLLVSKGYLILPASSQSPPPACLNCLMSKSCISTEGASNVYVITEKGKNFLGAGNVGNG